MTVTRLGGAALRVALPCLPDLLALRNAAPDLFPCLLESAARGTERGRFDLLFASNGEHLVLEADGRLHGKHAEPDNDFLAALDRWWRAEGSGPTHDDLPFHGGWALYLGYEIAAQIEPSLRLPAATMGLPTALALRCPAAVVIDHRHDRAMLVAEPGQEALVDRIQAMLATPPGAPSVTPELGMADLQEDPPQRYLQGVQRSLDYIGAGDVFQVNLSRGWSAQLPAGLGADDVYRALRGANPAPFGALFAVADELAVISSSPERLVSRRGRRLETRPIAGTRPRLPGEDHAERVKELVGHPKERAEHIMLIDLERNDLGRVSLPGSVRVDELMAVESYTHVHHIESTVSGTAREGISPGQLIRAVFPGGTITGCPKVRCMQIIAELEGEGRGPYTGAVGWLDRSGDLDLNILIRTLWMRGQRLGFRAGAGVVADSDPQHELEETRAKARGVLRALGCQQS